MGKKKFEASVLAEILLLGIVIAFATILTPLVNGYVATMVANLTGAAAAMANALIMLAWVMIIVLLPIVFLVKLVKDVV